MDHQDARHTHGQSRRQEHVGASNEVPESVAIVTRSLPEFSRAFASQSQPMMPSPEAGYFEAMGSGEGLRGPGQYRHFEEPAPLFGTNPPQPLVYYPDPLYSAVSTLCQVLQHRPVPLPQPVGTWQNPTYSSNFDRNWLPGRPATSYQSYAQPPFYSQWSGIGDFGTVRQSSDVRSAESSFTVTDNIRGAGANEVTTASTAPPSTAQMMTESDVEEIPASENFQGVRSGIKTAKPAKVVTGVGSTNAMRTAAPAFNTIEPNAVETRSGAAAVKNKDLSQETETGSSMLNSVHNERQTGKLSPNSSVKRRAPEKEPSKFKIIGISGHPRGAAALEDFYIPLGAKRTKINEQVTDPSECPRGQSLPQQTALRTKAAPKSRKVVRESGRRQ